MSVCRSSVPSSPVRPVGYMYPECPPLDLLEALRIMDDTQLTLVAVGGVSRLQHTAVSRPQRATGTPGREKRQGAAGGRSFQRMSDEVPMESAGEEPGQIDSPARDESKSTPAVGQRDILSLVARLRRQTLLRLSAALGEPLLGLSATSRRLPLTSRWKRKLREVDATLGLVEKITPASIEAFLAALDAELQYGAADHRDSSSSLSDASWEQADIAAGGRFTIPPSPSLKAICNEEISNVSSDFWGKILSQHVAASFSAREAAVAHCPVTDLTIDQLFLTSANLLWAPTSDARLTLFAPLTSHATMATG